MPPNPKFETSEEIVKKFMESRDGPKRLKALNMISTIAAAILPYAPKTVVPFVPCR
jgi:hypothetical protein